VNHQILTADLYVQRTRFSSGVEVTVNYGDFPHGLEDGTELPPHGYRVRDEAPGGRSYAGRLEVRVVPQ
jgi:hypothetical protein